VQQVYNSSVVTFNELKNGLIRHDRPVRIQYHSKDSYKITAKMLGLMDDFKVRQLKPGMLCHAKKYLL
jgi:alpha-1,3-mannosyl-glycoprotein beta-1,2-N-acetylglucosaminyltransferase